MYLKRLDLQGFKSFPEKVKLEFNEGITAVVGPNGSGKSNISDSIRWVLGEQKAKTLRGDKMEDIIFAGTEMRKPLGFAEVSITIDNQDHKLPIEYGEVTVTRRVYRSGESEYQINGTQCRLKDIHELFMDTGIGKEGYSIIGQGKIDEILSSKSDDRRRLFEEAAGIVKFKTRKAEALIKLEKEEQNLVRVQDIIGELESQINPLKEQSEKAKEYLDIREKLKDSEISIFKSEIQNIDKSIKELEKNNTVLNENLYSETKKLNEGKEKLNNLKNKSDILTDEIQNINEKLFEIGRSIENKEGEIKLLDEQIRNIDININRLNENNKNLKNKIDSNKNEINIYNAKINSVNINLKSEQSKLKESENKFNLLNEKLKNREISIDEYKSEMIEKIRISTETKGNIEKIQSIVEQLNQRQEQLKSEKSYVESQTKDNETHILALKKQIELNNENQKQINLDIENLKNMKNTFDSEIENYKSKLYEQERKITQSNSKLSLLLDMEKEFDGYYKSVKSILKLRNKNDIRFKGIYGAVGELLSVEKKFETAIEVALGGAIQNIITKSDEDAKIAINYLKEYNLGRATFLPLTSIKAKNNINKNILSEKGVIGIAKELISFDKIFDDVIGSLLGNVIILDTLDNAVLVARKYKYTFKIVTLEGDVLSSGGAMTGGSILKKTLNVFSRDREIKELKAFLNTANESLNNIKSLIDNKDLQIKDIEQSLTNKFISLQEFEIKNKSSLEDIQRSENILTELNSKFKMYSIEEKQLLMQKEKAQDDISLYNNIFENVAKEIENIDNKLLDFENNSENEKNEKDEILKSITDFKINISNYEQSRSVLLENIKKIDKDIKSFEIELNNQEREIKSYKLSKEEKQKMSEKINTIILSQKNEHKDMQNKLNDFSLERKHISEELKNIENNINIFIETVSKLKNDKIRVESKTEKFFEERKRIINEMFEEYNVTYEEIFKYQILDISYNQLKKNIKDYKNQIKNLGSINVDSIQKYKEVKERFEFLTSQKEDIINAEKKLKSLITDLSKLMESQFKEQFKIISENFNIVFKEMFGGGKAYLKLSDEVNVLEAGIDIIAQPPGKKLQNMLLLSGGERALTAISILFAILKIKPSPFCILDEIEAALDDANVKRYAQYLKKFSSNTQFIVITHRKGTMEGADILYGITMQEKGVSKLVSVNFADTKYA